MGLWKRAAGTGLTGGKRDAASTGILSRLGTLTTGDAASGFSNELSRNRFMGQAVPLNRPAPRRFPNERGTGTAGIGADFRVTKHRLDRHAVEQNCVGVLKLPRRQFRFHEPDGHPAGPAPTAQCSHGLAERVAGVTTPIASRAPAIQMFPFDG